MVVSIIKQSVYTFELAQSTLAFSVLTNVRSMNEVFPLERVNEAYEHMVTGKARFGAVLTTRK